MFFPSRLVSSSAAATATAAAIPKMSATKTLNNNNKTNRMNKSSRSNNRANAILAGLEPKKHQELIRLYRALLKGAARYPTESRRNLLKGEVQDAFRGTHGYGGKLGGDSGLLRPENRDELDRQMVLGWERAKMMTVHATNMYWFQSRDKVDKRMMQETKAKEQRMYEEAMRCNRLGAATDENSANSTEVKQYKNAMYQAHPDYFNKMEQIAAKHPNDRWEARGKNVSHNGGPKQRFWQKRYKARFPTGW